MTSTQSRREFLVAVAGAGCALATGCKVQAEPAKTIPPEMASVGHPARFWKATGQAVTCELCPHGCSIDAGKTGFCRTRRNVNGKLVSLVYGLPVTSHNDPIEKKPFNHVLPGSTAFSLATVGCNMTCQHCQNWELSQSSPGDLPPLNWSPADVAARAKRAGSQTVAFTYNEPTIWPEYILDTAQAVKEAGLRTVLISNGFIQDVPQRELARALAAYKIDLKGFSEKFYRDICGARLQPVLDGMIRIREEGCWLEIVTLLIPTLNDNPRELAQLAKWVRENVGADVPLHFTAFHPMYRLRNLPRTPVSTLEKARQIALDAGLHYVYTGNAPGHPGAHTYCPRCGELLVRRLGMSGEIVALKNGKCGKCGAAIPGVWA